MAYAAGSMPQALPFRSSCKMLRRVMLLGFHVQRMATPPQNAQVLEHWCLCSLQCGSPAASDRRPLLQVQTLAAPALHVCFKGTKLVC